MDSSSSPTERFLQETFHKARSFETLLRHIKARTPQSGTRDLLEIAIAIIRTIHTSLEMELEANPQLSNDEVLELCARRQQLLDELHKLVFDVVQPAEYSLYPIGVIAVIEDLISDIVPDFALVLNPFSGSTYEIMIASNLLDSYRDVLSPYVREKSEEEQRLPDWVIILSYPAAASTDILLHTIMMGHEVIHLRDYVDDISPSLIANREVTIIKETVRTEASRWPWDRASLFEVTERVLRNWLAELVADLVAVRIYGPAYLCSFARHSLAQQVMDQYSNGHPSSRMRLRLMLDELRDLGYMRRRTATQRAKEELLYWSNFTATTGPQPSGPHYIAMRSIERARKRLTRRIRIATQGKEFTAGRYVAEVQPLLKYLQHGIPPSEIIDLQSRKSEPASIPGILNAGALYYLYGMSELIDMLQADDNDSTLIAFTKLNGLLARAIEASYAFKEWRRYEETASQG